MEQPKPQQSLLTLEIQEAVKEERNRCLQIALAEYVRWRDETTESETYKGVIADGITIGGIAAAANIAALILLGKEPDGTP